MNTAPKLVLLDVGMVAELTPDDQQNLVGFFKVCMHSALPCCKCFGIAQSSHNSALQIQINMPTPCMIC